MKLLPTLLGAASLAVAPLMALYAYGDGTFQGNAQCKALAPTTCGNFNGKLTPGHAFPAFFGYADKFKEDPNFDPCAKFIDACKNRLQVTTALIYFGCEPKAGEKRIVVAYCTESRNRGGSWDVTRLVGQNQTVTASGLKLVERAKNGCKPIQDGWCSYTPKPDDVQIRLPN